VRACSVDVRSLVVSLTDAALSSDLFPDAYQCLSANVDDDDRRQVVPVRWTALELLDAAVDDRRPVLHEPATDVVSYNRLTSGVARLRGALVQQ